MAYLLDGIDVNLSSLRGRFTDEEISRRNEYYVYNNHANQHYKDGSYKQVSLYGDCFY